MPANKYSQYGHPKGTTVDGVWTRNGGTENGSAVSEYEHPQGITDNTGAWVMKGGENEKVSPFGFPKYHTDEDGNWVRNV